MASERRTGPVEALRGLALSLERLAASEAASGAVRGAADGLRKELPELDGQVRALVHDVLTVLARLAHDAAEREGSALGATTHTLAAAATQGILDAMAQEQREGGLPIRAFLERLNRVSDQLMEYARSRTEEIHTPGQRARVIVRSLVTEASEQIHEAMPGIADDARALIPLGAEVASQVGRGLVEGLESKLHEDSDALAGLLERVGRGLVRGLAAGVREELAASPMASGDALGASLEKLAERTAAATVRGAGGALEVQGRRWREALRKEGALRRASRELVGGVLESLGSGLRRPLMAVAGAGSALVVLSVLAVRWRAA